MQTISPIAITFVDGCERPRGRCSLSSICSPCLPRPIPNSYWATPLLLACEYPWSPFERSTVQKLDKLLAAGVRTFIDLTECGELSPYYPHLPALVSAHGIDISEIEYHQFPIHDRSLPESKEYMFHILGVLRDNQKRGIGRTGMVVGCWLVESETAKSGEEALRIVADKWKTVEKCKRYPNSPETGPQFEFVKNFRPRMDMEVA
ncbi:protein-tyrosine phosphatase-like protein [Pisolithus orientalis]|uniref:protein-tyrosine phosphatase-like protein n=1 Tax=Pisolithus orientalis TaxID=936130 RepID=UPI0022248FA8|nr:protein-tyrosine phosphatase-like protein [Pisolithus orientalis]KAI5997813.1 protein-tyrosine phosphatase-like protein [Pisolithus orientalis]